MADMERATPGRAPHSFIAALSFLLLPSQSQARAGYTATWPIFAHLTPCIRAAALISTGCRLATGMCALFFCKKKQGNDIVPLPVRIMCCGSYNYPFFLWQVKQSALPASEIQRNFSPVFLVL